MFGDFLFHLRAQGLHVGTGEWLGLLRAMEQGLIADVPSLYSLGRALLCRTETEFDGYDLAFAASFQGAALPSDLREKLEEWLNTQRDLPPTQRPPLDERRPPSELWKELADRLQKQRERHDGGDHWVGTKGTSPFGNSGEGKGGLRLGGEGGRGGAVQVAMERKWANYRTDRTLDVRDFEVALRALRNLRRDGRLELDLDGTIAATARAGGDIEVVERPERKNQVHLVLMLDAGGSMMPHAERVERLFTAASRSKLFRSFKHYSFHNCVYDRLYTDFEKLERVPTTEVLNTFTPRHRVVFVGDASMAPYELFSSFGWPGEGNLPGIDWLRRIHDRCPAAVWLNPDPPRFWNHPTVSAIGRLFPMHELTVDGLRAAIRRLRAPV
jgi:uncharacterized protein with von Willebrand factor type A (vWA) domain